MKTVTFVALAVLVGVSFLSVTTAAETICPPWCIDYRQCTPGALSSCAVLRVYRDGEVCPGAYAPLGGGDVCTPRAE